MHCPSDPKQTAISDLSKVILCLVAPRFEHITLVIQAKEHKHLAIAAYTINTTNSTDIHFKGLKQPKLSTSIQICTQKKRHPLFGLNKTSGK